MTGNIPDLPPWGTVSNIEPSSHDVGTAYISVDFHQVNNFDPYIYRTTDFGESWTHIADTIPSSVLSFVHVVREDPVRPGLLYAGTENAVYVLVRRRWALDAAADHPAPRAGALADDPATLQ